MNQVQNQVQANQDNLDEGRQLNIAPHREEEEVKFYDVANDEDKQEGDVHEPKDPAKIKLLTAVMLLKCRGKNSKSNNKVLMFWMDRLQASDGLSEEELLDLEQGPDLLQRSPAQRVASQESSRPLREGSLCLDQVPRQRGTALGDPQPDQLFLGQELRPQEPLPRRRRNCSHLADKAVKAEQD